MLRNRVILGKKKATADFHRRALAVAYQAIQALDGYVHYFTWNKYSDYVERWKESSRKKAALLSGENRTERKVSEDPTAKKATEPNFLSSLDTEVKQYDESYPHFSYFKRFCNWLSGYSSEMRYKKQWVTYQQYLTPIKTLWATKDSSSTEGQARLIEEIKTQNYSLLPANWRSALFRFQQKIITNIGLYKKSVAAETTGEGESEMKHNNLAAEKPMSYLKARAYLGLSHQGPLTIANIHVAERERILVWNSQQSATAIELAKTKKLYQEADKLKSIIDTMTAQIQAAATFLIKNFSLMAEDPGSDSDYQTIRDEYTKKLEEKVTLEKMIMGVPDLSSLLPGILSVFSTSSSGPSSRSSLSLAPDLTDPKCPIVVRAVSLGDPVIGKAGCERKESQQEEMKSSSRPVIFKESKEEYNRLVFCHFLGLDPYDVKTTPQTIKKAYRKLRMEMHADHFLTADIKGVAIATPAYRTALTQVYKASYEIIHKRREECFLALVSHGHCQSDAVIEGLDKLANDKPCCDRYDSVEAKTEAVKWRRKLDDLDMAFKDYFKKANDEFEYEEKEKRRAATEEEQKRQKSEAAREEMMRRSREERDAKIKEIETQSEARQAVMIAEMQAKLARDLEEISAESAKRALEFEREKAKRWEVIDKKLAEQEAARAKDLIKLEEKMAEERAEAEQFAKKLAEVEADRARDQEKMAEQIAALEEQRRKDQLEAEEQRRKDQLEAEKQRRKDKAKDQEKMAEQIAALEEQRRKDQEKTARELASLRQLLTIPRLSTLLPTAVDAVAAAETKSTPVPAKTALVQNGIFNPRINGEEGTLSPSIRLGRTSPEPL